ncbi:MAG: hypothetical protein K8S87_09305 [Planctomycetes bacterium]|nr:hypothetical protein [Planctomycetota bacterium]
MKSKLTLSIIICSIALFGLVLTSCGEKTPEPTTAKCDCGKVMQKSKMISFEVEGAKMLACSEECKKEMKEADHSGHNH